MITKSEKMSITGLLEDQGSGSTYAWSIDGESLMSVIQWFVNRDVKITIETIEGE